MKGSSRIVKAAALFLLFFFMPLVSEAKELPQLRIGVSYAPGAFEVDGYGGYEGALYNHIENLAVYAEFDPVYVADTLENNLRKVENGELDMALAAQHMDGAEDGLLRTTRSIVRMPCYLFLRDGDGLVQRIGYCRTFHNLRFLGGALAEYGSFGGVKYIPVPYETTEELRQAWETGVIDGMVATGFERAPLAIATGNLFLENFYLAVRKDRFELMGHLTRSMERIRSSSSEKNWGDSPDKMLPGGQPLFLRQEEIAYLRAHPVIRVSVFSGQAPYAYEAGDEVHGIYADYLKRAGKDLGVEFKMVPAGSYAESLAMVHDGRADMVASVYTNAAWARENNMWFTFPYMESSYTGIVRRDRESVREPRVAAVRGLFFTRQYVENTYPQSRIIYFDTDKECVEAVRNGTADIFFTKILLAQLILMQPEYAVLYSTGQSVMLQDISMGVCRNADPVLVRILNKEIAHIGTADTQAIIDESALAITPEHSWRTFVYYYPVKSLCAVIVISTIIIGGVVYIYRQKQKNYERLQVAAYRYYRNGLYNLRWFEENLPEFIEENKEARAEGRLYIMLNNICHFDRLMAVCSRNEAAEIQKKVLEELSSEFSWFQHYATPGALNQSYVFCCMPKDYPIERVIAGFKDNIHLPSNMFPITMQYNVGFVQVPKTGEISAQELIQQVEIAQAEADETGVLCCIYDEKLMSKRAKQQKIENIFPAALENNEFYVWYQPKYDLYSGAVAGAEALVRWNSSELGSLSPGQFIPVLERTNLILALDYFVLRETMLYLKRRLDAGLTVVPVSVNQSGKHISEVGYIEKMKKLAEEIPLPEGLVELEITETAFVDYDSQAAREYAVDIAKKLRDMGYRLAMDDFCTGYSSIAMLHTLPMDTIKIDRAILLAAENDDKGRTILRGVIDFGRRLRLSVLCEGIETQEQEQMLREEGCMLGQGFLFAQPMNEEAFSEFLSTHVISNDMV